MMQAKTTVDFYSSIFKRNQKVHFSFKVVEDTAPIANYLAFGIHGEREDKMYQLYGTSGNQFCMIKDTTNKLNSKDVFD